MERVRPSELTTAARVADGLVVVVGLAGVVAGAQLYRAGDVPLAVVAWVLTFVAGAALRLVVWMARGIAEVLARVQRTEEDVARLLRDAAGRDRDVDDGPGPWGWR